MKSYVLVAIFFATLFSCKQDKAIVTAPSDAVAAESAAVTPTISRELYTKLDRLRVRTDSSMNSKTAITISEGDTLTYLGQLSSRRLAMQLRGQYYYEPWMKVKHLKSGKSGWVYGGAVKYDSPKLKRLISESSDYYDELYADDLEWGGTVPVSWSTASISNPLDFKIFLLNFKDLVRRNEAAAIAELIKYPIRDLTTKEEFIDNFNLICSERMKIDVARQRLDRIFRDRNGAKIGDDRIVFREIAGKYRIVNMDFSSRKDVIRRITKGLEDTYSAPRDSDYESINAFVIRDFLELTLSYKDPAIASSSLGKFIFESSENNHYTYYQDTDDSLKRKVIIHDADEYLDLKVSGGLEPQLDGLTFTITNEI